MLVMIANQTSLVTGYLAGRYGSIGHLYSPGGQRGPWSFMPYALDNGAYPAYSKGTSWEFSPWKQLLKWAKNSAYKPLWVLVPDVVGDSKATLKSWDKYSPIARRYGWPLAFAVQDGMKARDVPSDADVVFVGGTTIWKWKTVPKWCDRFERVHVGRVNSYHRLKECYELGVESCDGTGWMRGDKRQFRELETFLAESHFVHKAA